jgi:hypothetical protein
MRIAIAILLLLHGFAHAVGFVGAWGLNPQAPLVDHLLGGRLPLSPMGIKLMGLYWLVAGLAVMGSGLAALLQKPFWMPLALGTGAASLLLCLLTLPEAQIGALLNGALLMLLTAAMRQGWAWTGLAR